MAHFRGGIQGSGPEVTRLGTATSGVNAHVRGWKIGARAIMTTDAERDTLRLYVVDYDTGVEQLVLEMRDNEWPVDGVISTKRDHESEFSF